MHEEFAKGMWNGKDGVMSALSVRQLVDLSSSPDCDSEQLAGYSSGPADVLDAHIELSSF